MKRPVFSFTHLLVLACLLLPACTRSMAGSSALPSGAGAPRPSTQIASRTATQRPTASATATTRFTASATLTTTPTITNTATPSPSPTVTQSPTPEGVYHPAGLVAAPVLMYHRISAGGANDYYTVTLASFSAQMKLLADQGYRTVTVSELAAVVRDGGYLPPLPVVITFDDGFQDVYDNAFPILQSYGFRATTYIISGVLESDLSYGYMQPDALRELVAAGWEIGSHSITHSDMKFSRMGMGTEMAESKADLEARLGVQVFTFAYPFASANDWIKDQVPEYGYNSAAGVGTLNWHSPNTLFYLSRRQVENTTSLQAFQKLLALPPEPTAAPTPETTPTP